MSRATLLELTCDLNPMHRPVTVSSWAQARELGWSRESANGEMVDRCPSCTPPAPVPVSQRTWDELYRENAPMVFRYINFRCGGNRSLAEDLTSETFLRALRSFDRYEDRGKEIGAWLVTIARNLVYDHFKSGRFRFEVAIGDVLDADRADAAPGPEQAATDYLTNVALLTAVKQLRPEQRECIVLRFLRGLSTAETAQVMGKDIGAIKALQFRAVRALARDLPEGALTR